MAFNNSTNHSAIPDNGLNAAKINVNPGEKQPRMHSTFFGLNNTTQLMIFPPDHSQYSNEPKDI